MSWDKWSSDAFPLCTEFEQLESFEQFSAQLLDQIQSQFVNITECPLPCNYREFRLVGEPVKLDKNLSRTGFHLAFATTDVSEKKEELIYPLLSFVAEFGGSLGLFLGFSFLMVYDVIIGCINVSSKALS